MLNRRQCLQTLLASGTALLCNFQGSSVASAGPAPGSSRDRWLGEHGPIDATQPDLAPARFFGDDNRRPHQVLWNLSDFWAQHAEPQETEHANLVVVGGGASGLFSAFDLREYKPIVLEQAARLGGNAKGQTFNGVPFGLGSAYIELPTPGTPMASFYDALHLDEILVKRRSLDPVAIEGLLYDDFWAGGSDPKQAARYLRLNETLHGAKGDIATRGLPRIVPLNDSDHAKVRHYDQWSLHSYLEKAIDGPLPAQLETLVEHYCWSTYAGSARELSAAAVLGALAKEAGIECAGAGGNAAITQRLVERLQAELPAESLRPSSIVVRVRPCASGVDIFYLDANDKLRKIRARTVIMACPKFVAARIVEGISPARRSAIASLRYRSYVTAHVLINKAMPHSMFDVYLGHRHKTDLSDVHAAQEAMGATDVILANWATPTASCNVLTLYQALPYDGARASLLGPHAYDATKAKLATQVEREILPLFKLKPKDVIDTRLALWGHALPLATQGMYQGDTVANLRAPHAKRVFFVEQDNWAYPALPTGATECILQGKQIRASLATS